MLPLPQKFDSNEWVVIASFIGTILLLYLLPKRFPGSMTILIMLFSSFFARALDHVLAAPGLDLYDVLDTGKYELFDLLSYFMYAPFAYLFVYIYDKYRLRSLSTVLYICVWSFIALGTEWVMVKLHLFEFKGWTYSYSFTIYLFVQFCTVMFYRYLKKEYPA